MIKFGVRVFGILGAVAIVFLVIGGITRTKGKALKPSKVHTVGLPEHGIEIIGPDEADFGVLMSKESLRIRGADVDAVKLSSVFVVNNSSKSMAALSVKWELAQADGRSIVHLLNYDGGLKVLSDSGPAHFAENIKPNAHRLVSLLEVATPPNKRFRVNMGGGSVDKAHQLSESVKITVSVDGVLFVDGTFVGPDTRGFFQSLKAQVEARSEVLTDIARALNGDSQAMNRVEMLARDDSEGVQISSARKDVSSDQMLKQQLARTTLALRKELGEKVMLERINAELSKPRIELRKL